MEISLSRKSMTSFKLKIIAMSSMIVDHFAHIYLRGFQSYQWARAIGRIAFPLYAFLVAESCRYTRHREHYLLRLGLFALISEVPYDLAFNAGKIDFLTRTNIFYTLFLAVALIHIFDTIRRCDFYTQIFSVGFCIVSIFFWWSLVAFITGGNPHPIIVLIFIYIGCLLIGCKFCCQKQDMTAKVTWKSNILSALPTLPILFLSEIIGCDYDVFGVLLIALIYMSEKRQRQIVILGCGIFFQYGIKPVSYVLQYGGQISLSAVMNFLAAMVVVLLVCLYNGQRGKNVKWAFYWAYPIHITILIALHFILGVKM